MVREDLRRGLGQTTSIPNLGNALRALKLSPEISPPVRPSGSGRMSPRAGPPGPPSRPSSTPAVYRNETFGTTAVTRLHGRGGDRGVGPHATATGRRQRPSPPSASTAVDGAGSGAPFARYVRLELAPRMRPGDLLVPDHLPVHMVKGVAEAAHVHVPYLPTYSLDFNPIEQVFSEIKNELRRRVLRTTPALEDAIGQSLDWLTRADARHDVAHSAYTPG